MEKPKRERKKYPRPSMVRFTTDEAKVILMAMNYSKNREVFLNEGDRTERVAYGIVTKLKHRIEAERQKKDKEKVITFYGEEAT
jgi:hypothetical protein